MSIGICVQGMTFCYTERGTLTITLASGEQKELNPSEAAALLTYLYDEQGELFKFARQHEVQDRASYS